MIRPSDPATRKTPTLSANGGGPVMRTDPGALVRELLRPEAYPQPRPAGVELRQTHASWVFLTDTEAWKVKRPVDYGFLDFSDAEKRQRCCEEEVLLGQRLAPDIYVGVAPIHRGDEGHSFKGPGPIVDHAVRMRRLPDEESAAMLLASGRLTPLHLQRLAERLARFYEACPTTEEMGAPSVLAANVDENHAQTLPFAGRFLDRDLVERLHDWQRAMLASRRDRLLDRVAAGRIRDGHGDLRLEHVYYPGGDPESPLVIDPIEFSRRLRCGDAALDAAFLAMDLDAQHRPDLAAWFLSSFARASNDHDLYPVVDLYLSYRAWVRAKVACFVAADPRTAPAKASRKAREAASFLALAASYAQQTPRAPVIIVGGAIGAGKSTLANALSLALRLPVISSDETRKHLAGIPARVPGDQTLYTEEHTARTYAEVLRRARAVIESGRGVILDGTFPDRATRATAMALAREAGRPFRLLELDADDRILSARLDRRQDGETVSDARAALLPRFRATYQPPDELHAGERLALDGSRDTDDLVRQVRDALSAR
jgi:aminoglycoside phosphotransferase family enzyme/predicted kinase